MGIKGMVRTIRAYGLYYVDAIKRAPRAEIAREAIRKHMVPVADAVFVANPEPGRKQLVAYIKASWAALTPATEEFRKVYDPPSPEMHVTEHFGEDAYGGLTEEEAAGFRAMNARIAAKLAETQRIADANPLRKK